MSLIPLASVARLMLLVVGVGYGAACVGQEPALPADIVLRGGNVITVDTDGSIQEAVAIRGNRIVAVGSDSDLDSWIGASTKVMELRGKTLVPGFIDSHNHVEHTARSEHLILRVHSPPLESSAEVLEKVVEKVAELPAGSWILGQGTYGQEMPSKWCSAGACIVRSPTRRQSR